MAVRRLPRLEDAALVLAATLMTLWAEWPILFHPLTFQADAQIHTFWMRRFQNPGLFHDPLTTALVDAGYVPLGVQGVYRVASYLVDPVTFGPWLPLVLAPLSAWLLFRIVREHTPWRPAAWMGAALLLLPVDVLRFSGGHARAFNEPVLLLTLYLLIRGRSRVAAAVPAVGALLYPPAALAALATMAGSSLTLRGRRPGLDRARAVATAVSAAGTAAALLVPRLTGSGGQLISESVARRYPEFGAQGQMNFFHSSVLEMLNGPYSGFNMRPSMSILLLGAVALLVVRPRNAGLLRREVWWMAVASLALFGLAYAVLFRLYVPDRYATPLLPFSCIVIAVCWRPTLEAVAGRFRLAWLAVPAGALLALGIPYLALHVSPLGPDLRLTRIRTMLTQRESMLLGWLGLGVLLCTALWLLRRRLGTPTLAALAAVLAGSLLLGEVAVAGRGQSPSAHCNQDPRLYRYLGSLPENTILAGDPVEINCVPIVARRAVVMSRKLYQVYDVRYLHVARPRMFDMINAYFGDSIPAIAALRTRYGAGYLIVRRPVLEATRPSPRWSHMQPFTSLVARLFRTVRWRAALHLPARCETWHRGPTAVYDLSCVGTTVAAASVNPPEARVGAESGSF